MTASSRPGPALPDWWHEHVATLVRQFTEPATGNAAWIAVASTDGLHGAPENGLFRAGGRIRHAEGRDPSAAFVWAPDDSADVPELWVSPQFGPYRDLFEEFIAHHHRGASLEGFGLDVDHLFPAANAREIGLSHVRMLAVLRSPNRSAGTLESLMVRRSRVACGPQRPRLATMHAIGKAVGHVGYSGLDIPARRRQIADSIADLLGHHGVGEGTSEVDRQLFAERLEDLK